MYCSTVPKQWPVFKVFLPGTSLTKTKTTSGQCVCLFIHDTRQLFRIYLDLLDHAGRQRWAADHITAGQLTSDFCCHGHWAPHNISYDAQWLLVQLPRWTPAKFRLAGHGWLLQNTTFYKQHYHTSLKGNLKQIKPDGLKVNALKDEASRLLLFTYCHKATTLCLK